MRRSLILVILTAVILTATTLVASAAGAFLWAGMTGLAGSDRASSGLMAAIYAPFALVALLLPVMSAPMARFGLRVGLRVGANASAATALEIPLWLAWLLVFAGAEVLTALARAAAGDRLFSTALYVHALLAGYAAAAAWLLRRPPSHAGDTSTDAH